MARKLHLDVDERIFVAGVDGGFFSALEAFEGDNADYELFFLTKSAGGTTYEPLDYSAKDVALAIGAIPPAAGTYVLATAGAFSDLGSTVSASIARTITGGAATNESQLLTIEPDAFGGTFTLTFPSQALTFTAVSAGLFTTSGGHGLALRQAFVPTGFSAPTAGLANGNTYYVAQIVSRTQFFANSTGTGAAVVTYSGDTGAGYTITGTSTALEARATTATVEAAAAAMPAIGENNIRVTGTPGRSYRFDFINAKGQAALPLMTVAHAMTPVYGKSATLDFNTVELLNAISASASIDAVLEIEVSESGTVETVAQVPITLRNDIIGNATTPSPVVSSSFLLTASDASVWEITIDASGLLAATKQP
jgi:hypothetical protein